MSQNTLISNKHGFLEFEVKQSPKAKQAKKTTPLAVKVLIGAIMMASLVYLTMPQQAGSSHLSFKSHKGAITKFN